MTKSRYPLILILLLQIFARGGFAQELIYKTQSGKITFKSNALLEAIRANSDELKGVLDITKKTFAFKVQINTFTGFNSDLQQEHFNENYLESEDFKDAHFYGKIIEDLDFTQSGKYEVRAKGKLYVHGIEQERIIKVELTIDKEIMQIRSVFEVALSDHHIAVPRVVHEKIAQIIEVTVSATLKKYQ